MSGFYAALLALLCLAFAGAVELSARQQVIPAAIRSTVYDR